MIARSLPKCCSWNTDRHGRKRVRFRKGFYSTYHAGIPYSEDFMQRYHAALDGNARHLEELKEDRVEPGTIDAVIVNFYRSTDFVKLKARTKKCVETCLRSFVWSTARNVLHAFCCTCQGHYWRYVRQAKCRKQSAQSLARTVAPCCRHGVDC
jgi:hypothetical protein